MRFFERQRSYMNFPMWIPCQRFLIYSFVVFIFSSLIPHSQNGIRYTQPSTIPFNADSQQTQVLEYTDTVSGETLYQVNTLNHSPIYYYRNIRTGVCLDDKCRPLNVMVLWNITGRYLGFALPEKEFLSKYDHEPFTTEEYERLNMILADSLLPLGKISFEKLIQKSATPSPENAEVDGVSGATSPEISDYVIEGAAYTTYTLWNIIYGSSQSLVKSLTLNNLSDKLITAILQSPDTGDRFWALNHLNGITGYSPALENELLKCISDENYSLGVAALKAIDTTTLQSTSLQIHLLEKFYQCSYGLKILILNKLKEAPHLSDEVIIKSSRNLHSLNGKLLQDVLDLYRIHKISDEETIHQVAKILNNNNRFISQKAFEFLNELEVKDSLIQKQLSDYTLQLESPG